MPLSHIGMSDTGRSDTHCRSAGNLEVVAEGTTQDPLPSDLIVGRAAHARRVVDFGVSRG